MKTTRRQGTTLRKLLRPFCNRLMISDWLFTNSRDMKTVCFVLCPLIAGLLTFCSDHLTLACGDKIVVECVEGEVFKKLLLVAVVFFSHDSQVAESDEFAYWAEWLVSSRVLQQSHLKKILFLLVL